MKLGNYVVIQSWMVSELKLKGNELLIYAVIYGFSQDDQCFSGTLKYLQDWTASTKQGVLKALKSLTDKDLLRKYDRTENGVHRCAYQTVDPQFLGGQQSLPEMVNKVDQLGKQSLPEPVNKVYQGGQQSLPIPYKLNNNIDNNLDNSPAPKKTAEKHRYGEHHHVLLTDAELDKLKQLFPADWGAWIEKLDEGIELKGYRYKSHLAAIRKWARQDAEREGQRPEVDRRGFYQAPPVAPGERPKDDMALIRQFLRQQESGE